jgi:hypothetical protein
LDENLAEAIRWIGPSEFGILGVAGFCHGDACALRTTVYEVAPAVVDEGWRLRPLALLKGCPAATELDPAGKSLVAAVHCGALHRISAQATSDIATWPAHLSPSQLLVTRSADGSGTGLFRQLRTRRCAVSSRSRRVVCSVRMRQRRCRAERALPLRQR